MAQTYQDKFEVFPMQFDDKALLDENSFYAHKLGKPDHLTGVVTFMFGKFPLAARTFGNNVLSTMGSSMTGPSTVKELNDFQYMFPVMGAQFKPSTVAVTNSDSQVGRYNTSFKVVFTDKQIRPGAAVETPSQVLVIASPDQPRDVAGGYEYTFTIVGDEDAFVPASDLVSGKHWGDIFVPGAQSESRGTEFRWNAPGMVKNQMSLIRSSLQWSGNAANFKTPFKYNVNINGEVESGEFWIDQQMARYEYQWLMEIEQLLMYSKYNRNANGTLQNKDQLSGKSVPLGAGLLDQIVNYKTYTELTYAELQGMIRDALFGQYDQKNKKIKIQTGLGGIIEIDRVLKEQGNADGIIAIGDNGSKFVKGEGNDLMLTGFFRKFAMIDGYAVEIEESDLFNYGMRAMVSSKHPKSGLPLESYRMVCFDEATYDGEPNVCIVTEKGRKFQHGIVPGMTNIPSSLKAAFGTVNSGGAIPMLATDKDIAGYHRLLVAGAQLKRANTSFHLECVLGK